MIDPETKRRFGEARVARLATVGADGSPHQVPVTFALEGDTVHMAIDHKPKRTRRLRRLENIRANPRVCLLVDVYGERWAELWWVRADGRARIVESGVELQLTRNLLAAKYPQYRDRPPDGPAVVIDVERWAFWSAS
jgi:PPOX class probable F420-dependent enzyme